ncbi:hypothetical protein [Leifsonia aquatica]|uniref:hypothetical protein n=1 Tax=Leifsonia aquatica TaxID=144185 RepID=UPI00381FDF2D
MDQTSLQTLHEAVRLRRTPLFHGGVPDLAIGELLLPPSVTGVESLAAVSARAGLRNITTNRDLVYVTIERRLAVLYAAHWAHLDRGSGRGWVYRVALDEEHTLAPDSDLPRGPFVSFQVPRARVAAILDRGGSSPGS